MRIRSNSEENFCNKLPQSILKHGYITGTSLTFILLFIFHFGFAVIYNRWGRASRNFQENIRKYLQACLKIFPPWWLALIHHIASRLCNPPRSCQVIPLAICRMLTILEILSYENTKALFYLVGPLFFVYSQRPYDTWGDM